MYMGLEVRKFFLLSLLQKRYDTNQSTVSHNKHAELALLPHCDAMKLIFQLN